MYFRILSKFWQSILWQSNFWQKIHTDIEKCVVVISRTLLARKDWMTLCLATWGHHPGSKCGGLRISHVALLPICACHALRPRPGAAHLTITRAKHRDARPFKLECLSFPVFGLRQTRLRHRISFEAELRDLPFTTQACQSKGLHNAYARSFMQHLTVVHVLFVSDCLVRQPGGFSPHEAAPSWRTYT